MASNGLVVSNGPASPDDPTEVEPDANDGAANQVLASEAVAAAKDSEEVAEDTDGTAGALTGALDAPELSAAGTLGDAPPAQPAIASPPPADPAVVLPGAPADSAEPATEPSAEPEPASPTPVVETPTPTTVPETATPAPPPLAADLPTVPFIDGALQARLQAIWADGQARGRRADVFAKVGDSLTVSGFFLAGLGCDTSRLGAREDLRPIVDLYRAASVPAGASVAPCAAANPLTRRPVSAGTGWLTAHVFAPLRGEVPPECAPPNHTALHCEVALIQPSVAIVTLGTNDVHMNSGAERYGHTLSRIVDELAALGVIPLLSTLPPRTDRPAMAERTNRYNEVVVRVAAERQAPLINLWRDLAVEGLVRGGMEPDGVHMNAAGYGASFTESGLRYGQNRRNALVLDALAKVRRVVVEGGAADG